MFKKIFIFCLVSTLNFYCSEPAAAVINSSAKLTLPESLLSLPKILQSLPYSTKKEAVQVIKATGHETADILKQTRRVWNEESNQLINRSRKFWNEESKIFFSRINESTDQVSKNIANQITSVSNIIILKLLFAYIIYHGFKLFSKDSYNGIYYMTFGFIGFMLVEKILIAINKYFYSNIENKINPYENIILSEDDIINFKDSLKIHFKTNKKVHEINDIMFNLTEKNKLSSFLAQLDILKPEVSQKEEKKEEPAIVMPSSENNSSKHDTIADLLKEGSDTSNFLNSILDELDSE